MEYFHFGEDFVPGCLVVIHRLATLTLLTCPTLSKDFRVSFIQDFHETLIQDFCEILVQDFHITLIQVFNESNICFLYSALMKHKS